MCSFLSCPYALQLLLSGTGKADQWRHIISILPIALYVAWHIGGEIPRNMDAPRPRERTKFYQSLADAEKLFRAQYREELRARGQNIKIADTVTMNRSYYRHYLVVLEFCTAHNIFSSQSITQEQAEHAQACHNSACQSWARMRCHLTPNFHYCTHLSEYIGRLGPVYGWWTYPYERNNGFLTKVNHNGHVGGELEATLMRAWVKCSLVQDLVSFSHFEFRMLNWCIGCARQVTRTCSYAIRNVR